MHIQKNGFKVACEDCRRISSDTSDSFSVSVPVSDSETGTSGTAVLHCHVSPESHLVSLVEWRDAQQSPIEPSESMQQRLSLMLKFIEDHRTCGSEKFCPYDVISIVEQYGRS